MRSAVPLLPRRISPPVRVVPSQKVVRSPCPALGAVPRKPGQQGKRGGTIKTGSLLLGDREPWAARLLASRVPAALGNVRRSTARKHAKKKGDTPAHAPLTLRVGQLLLPNVPPTLWQTATVRKVSPLRWQRERMGK